MDSALPLQREKELRKREQILKLISYSQKLCAMRKPNRNWPLFDLHTKQTKSILMKNAALFF